MADYDIFVQSLNVAKNKGVRNTSLEDFTTVEITVNQAGPVSEGSSGEVGQGLGSSSPRWSYNLRMFRTDVDG